MASVCLSRVYEAELGAGSGWSLAHTGTVYSMGWEFDGRRLRVHLCGAAVAELEEADGGGRLVVRVYAADGERCWEQGLEALPWRLGLSEDLSRFHEAARGDPLAGCIPSRMPGWRLRSPSPWGAALVAVAQQNTGFRQGWGMLYRLHLAASPRLRGPGWVFLPAPPPGPALAEAAKASGWGYRADTLRRLAAVARAEPDLLEAGPSACSSGLLEQVWAVRGVGPYSRALVELFACRRYGSLPLDRWLKRLAAEAYGVDPAVSGAELERRFPGYAGLAALAATVCCDAVPLRKALERLRQGRCVAGLEEPSPVTLWRHTPPLNRDRV